MYKRQLDQQRAQIHALEAQAQAYAQSMGLDAYQRVVRTEEIAYQEVSALMVQTTRQSEQVQSVEAAARSEIAALRGAATEELHATRAGYGTEMARYRMQVQDEWQAATGRHQHECASLRTVAESYNKDRDDVAHRQADLEATVTSLRSQLQLAHDETRAPSPGSTRMRCST